MKRLELKVIIITVVGLIIGRVAPEGIKMLFKTISYNFFAFSPFLEG